MLALAVATSAGLVVLASRAHTRDGWRPAIYRYTANEMPDCADLAGRAPVMSLQRGRWFRMRLPDAPRRSPQGCLLRAHPTV